ncbi:MAG TPA: hypothetical protein VHZ98_01015 [Galbitalea sp.]|jgi:hypothetical protein|nr:hypothetical protein [Galbitalea sp.]
MLIYGPVALLLLLCVIGPIRGRTLSRLERLAPGSIAFTISNRKVFGERLAVAAVGTELGRRATGLTSAPCVTADTLGLTFWDNTPLERVGSLDWSRIPSLEVGELQTPFRRWSSSAILLQVTVGKGVVVVPLLSPNGTRGISGSRRESRYLLGLLETLRTTSVVV